MNKLYKKNFVLFATVLLILLTMSKVARANIFDNILNAIGITSEKKESNEANIESISNDIEEKLDSRQKEVVDKIEDIYNDIQNIDIAGLANSIDYKISTQVISNLDNFFENYGGAKDNLQPILKTIVYKIDDIRNEGNKVIAKITYTYPSIPKIITKVLPEIILKNARILFGGQITNDTIDSVLGSIKNEIKKGTYEVETFTREFAFERIGDEWKMVRVDEIVNDASKYINDISKSFLK